MHLPDRNASIWNEIVTGKKTCQLKFLAAKILLGRLTRSVKEDGSEENITAGIDQLYALYANNRNMPSARDDLAALSR
ncbi:hypothetical protein [Solidesulfovibrio alcoholivorans]|uniref:hypothetical protein n=1 Tax=Solidesulfovibrio alcoholivorans TaxID=81406 RepID=UPI000496662D|nr:hypothetical protein [Solidesulfovibrio alcoholivorans]